MTVPTGVSARVVLVHGFTQTGASWGEVTGGLRAVMGTGVELLTPDLPGHGDEAERPLDVVAGAARLGETCGPGDYVGYSMGGRVCLHLALARPDLVRRLVLIGATPGIDDPAERAARRAADEELARSVERDGIGPFLARWLSQPLFTTLPDASAGITDRLANTPAGLAASLRLMGTGHQEPLWDRLRHLTMPVLLITGELDTKFTGIARRMLTVLPDGRSTVVAGSGHAVHLEQPAAVVVELLRWLGQAESDSPSANAAP